MFTVQLLLPALPLKIIKDAQKSGSTFCNFPAVTDCTINVLCAFEIVRMEIAQLRIHEKRENRRAWGGRSPLLRVIKEQGSFRRAIFLTALI